MQKLRIWQIILLVIFFPAGIVYFLYWLFRTRIFPDNPQPCLSLWQIFLYSIFFPVGIVLFFIWLVKTDLCSKDQAGNAIIDAIAKHCKQFLAIASVVTVLIYTIFIGAIFSSLNSDGEHNDTFIFTSGAKAIETNITDELTVTTTAATSVSITTIELITTETPVTQVPVTTEKTVTVGVPILTDTSSPKVDIIIIKKPDTAHRNETVSLTIQGQPNTEYKLRVKYKSGWAEADGLGTKISDANGMITWTWMVGSRTTLGTWPIEITGDSQTLMTEFTVME